MSSEWFGQKFKNIINQQCLVPATKVISCSCLLVIFLIVVEYIIAILVYLWSWKKWYRNRNIMNLFQLDPEPEPEVPPPSTISANVNMMPFISSDKFEGCKLPEDLKPYWGIIKYCLRHQLRNNPSSNGRVFYLTIQESQVEQGSSQMKPGLHVEYRGLENNEISERLVHIELCRI